jgi:hypothetical protein
MGIGILSCLSNMEVRSPLTPHELGVTDRIHPFFFFSSPHTDQVEISPGQAAKMTSLPAPTSTATSIPGLSPSQEQYLASKTMTSSNNNARRIGAIVGGVLGGVVLVAAAVALFVWRARVKRRRATRDATAIIFAKGDLAMQEKTSSRD